MINQELDQEDKMGSFNKFLNKISLLILIFLILSSCKKEGVSIDLLLESNNLSNKIYTKEIGQLKLFFENKFQEQPEIYKTTQEKIISIENEILLFHEQKTIEEKRKFIRLFIIKLKKIFPLDDITFVCLKIDNDVSMFTSIAENDFNRILYLVYKASYKYHYAH